MLFERTLAADDVSAAGEEVVLTLVVRDIYSKGSSQRYTITLGAEDLEAILEAADFLDDLKAAE